MSERIRATGDSPIVAVVGLGYVGLPLVIEFGTRVRTIGFDIQADKVDKCRRGQSRGRAVHVGRVAARQRDRGHHSRSAPEYRELGPEDICRKLVRGGRFVDVKSAYDAS